MSPRAIQTERGKDKEGSRWGARVLHPGNQDQGPATAGCYQDSQMGLRKFVQRVLFQAPSMSAAMPSR